MFYDDPASGNATINPALISRRARNFTDVIVETRTVGGAVEPVPHHHARENLYCYQIPRLPV